MRDLTASGRKILLTYDAYRSHMTLSVLELFHDNGIVVYALPAHTSGKTQPCDVVLFSDYKKRLNESLSLAASMDGIDELDEFSYCGMMARAYELSFTRKNIQSSFEKAGIWPLDPSRLLSAPRPRGVDDLGTILGVEELQELFEEKRRSVRSSIIGADARIDSSGFIDTSQGMVLTSECALQLARKKAEQDSEKRKAKELKSIRAALASARREKAERLDIAKREAAKWKERARLANMSVSDFRESVRPIKERRAIAKLRKALRQ